MPLTPDDLLQLPSNLPVPVDDGAAAHLEGGRIPDIPSVSTQGGVVSLARIPGMAVVFCYPMTGRPNTELPEGWDNIPGARGCTPQCLAYSNANKDLLAAGATVFGLSVQDADYQRELAERLDLPFAILSDAGRVLTNALRLPTFEVGGVTLLKRLTMILRDGMIEEVFYPVLPPTADAGRALEWICSRNGSSA